MENTKTKKALIMSVLSMVLCVAMLIGMTFAWFTDTASTGVNKIQAGNLDVELQMYDGSNYVNISKESKPIFDIGTGTVAQDNNLDTLWEPGKTQIAYLAIKNEGNLALKYKVALNVTNPADGKNLYKVMEYAITPDAKGTDTTAPAWTSGKSVAEGTQLVSDANVSLGAGDTHYFALLVHMDEQAGNDYQGGKVDFDLSVLATQLNSENDSYGPNYDEDAQYPVASAASIADAVADLATAGDKKVSVTVAKNIKESSGIVVAKGNTLDMDFNGKSVGVSSGKGSANTTTNGMQLLQGSTNTMKNGTYEANHGEDKDHNIAILIQNYSNLIIDSCTLDMRNANDTSGNSKGTSYVISSNCGKVVIKGDTNIYARNSKEYALDVMHWENTSYKEEGTSVVFEESMTGIVDGKIDVYCYRNNRVVKPVDDGGATLVIKGGTFKNSGLTLEQFKAFVPSGYTVTTNTDGSYTVSK